MENIIDLIGGGIVGSIVVLLVKNSDGVINFFNKAIKCIKWSKRMKEKIDLRYFYPLSHIKSILSKNEYASDSEFIKYSLALSDGWYSNSTKWLKVKVDGEIKNIEIPYAEVIDYLKDSEPSIRVSRLCEQYVMPDSIRNLTDRNLTDFLHRKPNTYNGETLRIKSLSKISGNLYDCELQSATYFDQIRTNLTLDLPLLGQEECTLRELDLDKNKIIKPFSESIMANSIGVSAIWYTPDVHRKNKNGIRFFLKPRKSSTGVFYNALGTISGAVAPPKEGCFHSSFLEDYVKQELLREFYEETYNKNSDKDIRSYVPENKIEITLLAFVRELTRGGKPQFMFLIKTPYIDNSTMKELFNGSEEFSDNIVSTLTSYDLSPETYVNYLYAIRYIQRNQYLEYINLD